MDQARKTRTREGILDSAYALVSRMGMRKTTFEDIAAKAGVSRQTLYRYFGSKEELMASLMDRESERFLDALQRLAPEDTDLEGALQVGLVFTFDYLATHPLLSWIYEHERDELLPHLTRDWAPILDVVRQFIQPFIESEVQAGRITPERAAVAGDWVTRVSMSYMILPGEFVDLADQASLKLVPDLILRGLQGEPR